MKCSKKKQKNTSLECSTGNHINKLGCAEVPHFVRHIILLLWCLHGPWNTSLCEWNWQVGDGANQWTMKEKEKRWSWEEAHYLLRWQLEMFQYRYQYRTMFQIPPKMLVSVSACTSLHRPNTMWFISHWMFPSCSLVSLVSSDWLHIPEINTFLLL